MSDQQSFSAWLDQTITEDSHITEGIPLIGLGQLHLRDAQAAPLIVALADIIESVCVHSAAVPTTHATAA